MALLTDAVGSSNEEVPYKSSLAARQRLVPAG